MKKKENKEPLLYYRSKEEMERYRKLPLKQKLDWLQTQMEFFYKAMPQKNKKIREKFLKGEFKFQAIAVE